MRGAWSVPGDGRPQCWTGSVHRNCRGRQRPALAVGPAPQTLRSALPSEAAPSPQAVRQGAAGEEAALSGSLLPPTRPALLKDRARPGRGGVSGILRRKAQTCQSCLLLRNTLWGCVPGSGEGEREALAPSHAVSQWLPSSGSRFQTPFLPVTSPGPESSCRLCLPASRTV